MSPNIGRIAIDKTMIPIPPIHWVSERQKSSPWVITSKSGIIVAPVVVKPETVSKKASKKFGISRLITNGNAPINEAKIQESETIKKPSFAYITFLGLRLIRTKNPPTTKAIIADIRKDKKLFSWAKEAQERGAGEILFTSMNHDGVKQGFANDALAVLSESLSIPVIASGGAGTMEHFRDVFAEGKADAALAASIFHFHEIAIPDLKQYLKQQGVPVRLTC